MSFLKSLLTFALLAATSSVEASIINGGFETGTLTGWQSYASDVVGSDGSIGGVGVLNASIVSAPASSGVYTAFLQAGPEGEYQRLWQDVSVTSAGSQLSAVIKWEGHDSIYYDYAYNDDAYFRIGELSAGPSGTLNWATVWQGSVAKYGNADGGDSGSSPWETVNYTFSTTGLYRLEFGIRNVLDDENSSVMFVDNVNLATPVPESSDLTMVGVGFAIIGARARRGRKTLSAAN